MRLTAAVFVLALGLSSLAGCNAKRTSANVVAGSASAGQTYALRGRVVATDAANGRVTVAHQEIPGFMSAMTMPYRLAQPEVISELHPGDLITAQVLVTKDAAGDRQILLDQIDVIAESNPNQVPAVQYHVPKPGDAVPDFKLLDQSGKFVHLGQFRGKVVLLTFIYTRCPLPDYCVRLSNNFKKIDTLLAQRPDVYNQTHLLSISFDPRYDTPAVLRSYGGAYTGRFTKEDFNHWTFAAPSISELPKLAQYFDVGVNGSDPTTLTHSLSTVMIGKDGRILAWYPSNDWDPAEVAEAMITASKDR
jgi:protein SCO1/2